MLAMIRKRQVGCYLYTLSKYAGGRLWLALLLMLLAACTEGVGLLLLVPLLQAIGVSGGDGGAITGWSWLPGDFRPGLVLTLGVFVLLVTTRALLVRWREILLNEIQFGYVDHLRTRLYRAIGEASWSFLVRRRSAQLAHVLTVDISRVGVGTQYLLQLAVLAAMAIAHIVVAFRLSPPMTALAMAVGALLLTLLWPQVRRARELGEVLTRDGQRVYQSVDEFLDGLKLAKSYHIEQRHTQLFIGLLDGLRGRMLSFVRSRADAQMVFQTGAAVGLGGLVYLAVEVVPLPGAQLLVLTLVFARLMPLLSQMQRAWQQMVHMLPAYDHAARLIAGCEHETESLETGDPLQLRHQLALRGLRYSYPGADASEAIRGVDLVISAGSTTALMGPSGAGKSTLADILLGLLVPSEGELWVDGRVLSPAQLGRWRRSVAYVPQDSFLFHDSVRNNLLWAAPEADEQAIWAVLRQAAVDEVVQALPQGLDTVVGERGSRLSGGERQRITLARALLTKPGLLVLDEATSALDAANEAKIRQAIAALHGKMTVILIAHRPSTVLGADRVLVLDRGIVVRVTGPVTDVASIRALLAEVGTGVDGD